jgi:hypothetical protein
MNMIEEENLKQSLAQELQLLGEFLRLGQEILEAAGTGRPPRLAELLEERNRAFEAFKACPLPAGLRVTDLLDHPQKEVAALARKVCEKLQAAIDQNTLLQEKLGSLREALAQELQKLDLTRQVNKAYFSGLIPTGAAFFDKRR